MEEEQQRLWQRVLPSPPGEQGDFLREVAMQAAARRNTTAPRSRPGPFRWFRELLADEL